MTTTFNLPDLGEGLTDSEIVAWTVSEGDRVELNQTLAEIETAKAVVELPSPYEGVIRRLHAAAGDTVDVGAPLIDFDVDGEDSDQPESTDDADEPEAIPEPADLAKRVATRNAEAESDEPAADAEGGGEERVDVLVGSIRMDRNRPKRTPRAWDAEPFEREARPASAGRVRSTPPVRSYAKQRGVDLQQVPHDGEAVSRSDIDRYLRQSRSPAEQPRQRQEPIQGIRKHTAAAMVKSVSEVPHAAVFLDVDVTESVQLVRDLRESARDGTAPSFLSLVGRAVVRACALVPETNATFDGAGGEITYYDYVNLGIAVATPKGLVVASVDDADRLNAVELTEAIAERAASARAGSLTHAELTSSTITISNVGVFGVDTGVPIINPGESAILAVGAVRRRPWEHRGEVALREVLTLAVSFDHRLIDGAEASRFISAIGDVLERPALALVS